MIKNTGGGPELRTVIRTTGVIIGYTNLPVINEGDAAILDSEPSSAIEKHVTEHNNAEPMFDEDEII
jgi:hypothetical protein